MKNTFLHKKKNKIYTGDKSKTKVKGVHLIQLAKCTSDEAVKLQDQILENSKKRQRILDQRDLEVHQAIVKKKPIEYIQDIERGAKKICDYLWQEYNYFLAKLNRKFKTQEFVVENITTTVGRTVLAERLSGTTTYTGTVNYCAVGDDNTAETVGDSTLGNETSRKALSSGTYSSNTAYLETFFAATEAVDTHEEFGFYIDGAAGADTGQLFNRFTQQVVKSNIETMNVKSNVDFDDA